jgi:hypothetical protein
MNKLWKEERTKAIFIIFLFTITFIILLVLLHLFSVIHEYSWRMDQHFTKSVRKQMQTPLLPETQTRWSSIPGDFLYNFTKIIYIFNITNPELVIIP